MDPLLVVKIDISVLHHLKLEVSVHRNFSIPTRTTQNEDLLPLPLLSYN